MNTYSCYIKLKRILFFIFILLYINVFSQQVGTLIGLVASPQNEPVGKAKIYVKGTGIRTSTDANGNFKIGNLSFGNHYEIEVQAFKTASKLMKIHFQKNNQKVHIRLAESKVSSIQEVTLLGTQKQKNKEQGFAMNIIQTKEASLQNLHTTELLGRSTGIKIRQSAGLGSDMNLYLNGLTGNSVRIFIDGIPIRNYGRSFSIASIPPAMIERIEVYKGVLPTELSEDALGGGINIILKKDMRNNLTTSYSFGSFNTHQWDFNANYRGEETGFIANLSSFNNYTDNNYKVWGDNVYISDPETGKLKYITAKRFHDSYYSAGIRGNVGFSQKKWADEFLLGFMFSEMDKEIQTGAVMNRVYGSRETSYKSGMGSLQYKKKNIFLKGLNFNTFTTFSKTNRRVNDTDNRVFDWTGKPKKDYKGDDILSAIGQGEAGVATKAENIEINFANRSHLQYYFNENHSLSTSYFYDKFSRKVDDPLMPDMARELMDKRRYQKQIVGVSYEGNFFQKRLKTNLFYKFYNQKVALTEVRYNRDPRLGYTFATQTHNRDINHQGYGATLAYTIVPKLMLVASAEKAVRLPNINELLGNTSDMITPNYTLLPEHSRNLNLGFNLGELKFGKHGLSTEANFFVRDIRDLIIQGVPREIDNSFSYTNLGKIISKGVDMELRYNFDKKLFITSNASYNEARFNLEFDPFGVRYFYYKNRLRNQPYLTANTNVEYVWHNAIQKDARLTLNYNFGYTHQFFLNWENLGSSNKIIIPTQPIHDLGFTYTFPNRRWTFGFNAKNIFDKQVFDNFALQKPGRAFYGKLTYTMGL